MDSLHSLDNSWLATTIRFNTAIFAWIESVHVLAATVVVGTIAVVDLRLIGFASHRASVRQLVDEMLPFTWGAFALSVASGTLLFVSNPLGYLENASFLAKMAVLALAGINMAAFHLTAYRNVREWELRLPPPRAAKTAGWISLCIWTAVVFLARWIGFE